MTGGILMRHRTPRQAAVRAGVLAIAIAAWMAGPAAAGVFDTTLVSSSATGDGGSARSSFGSLSADGRYVVFESVADDLSDQDADGTWDVYVKDTRTGAIDLVSRSTGGVAGNADSRGHDAFTGGPAGWAPQISADGRYVSFQSAASNLVTGDVDDRVDIFLRDRALGSTRAISPVDDGEPGRSHSLSADGRWLAYGRLNTIWVWDRLSGEHTQVGGESIGFPSISDDGRWVAFEDYPNVFVADRVGGTISQLTDGSGVDDAAGYPEISGDGTTVAYWSNGEGVADGGIYVESRSGGPARLVSRADGAAGAPAGFLYLTTRPGISHDGRFVVFAARAENLDESTPDTDAYVDVFVRDVQADDVRLVSRVSGADAAKADGTSIEPALSADGASVAFTSGALNLSDRDADGVDDVFVRQIAARPPANRTLPSIDGSFATGETLTCDRGEWSNEPTGFRYQWLRDGQPIAGAIAATYRLTEADLEAAISCRVTASNADGEAVAVSHAVRRPLLVPGQVPTVKTDGPPIVFLPGFLASEMECTNRAGVRDNLWPDAIVSTRLNMPYMRLGPDGRSPLEPGDRCNSTAAPNGDVLESIAMGADGVLVDLPRELGGRYRLPPSLLIHARSMDWLRQLARDHNRLAAGFGWDWRKSPEDSVARLDAYIDTLRKASGQDQVVLLAHSYGGLLARWYTRQAGRAAKVARVADIGTPWWGTPKPWLAMAYGIETPVLLPPEGVLDVAIADDHMRGLVRNLTGFYHLFPSPAWYARAGSFRQWLSAGGRALTQAGVREAVAAYGGNVALLDEAARNHAADLDGDLRKHGVKWAVVAGAGEPTIGPLSIPPLSSPSTSISSLRYSWINGDGTVALASQRQGAAGAVPFGDPSVPVHYICGVGHMDEPEKKFVRDALNGFLLHGAPIAGEGIAGEPCALDRDRVALFTRGADVGVLEDSGARSAVSAAGPARSAAGGRLSLAEAESRGLVRVVALPDRIDVVSRVARPLTLEVRGRGVVLQTSRLTDAGEREQRAYGPVSGRVAVALQRPGAATASRNGRRLRARTPDRKAPRTRVRVRRRGRTALLRFHVRDASRVAATWWRVGKGKPRRVRRGAARVRVRDLRRIRFASVDVFGNTEQPRRISR